MRAVIFDFDGVLVDSEPLHYRALRESLLPEGIVIEEEEYARSYLAYDDRESIRVALERHRRPSDPARVEAVAERKASIFDAVLSEVPFFPGARDLVRALSREVPLGIASGALRREIDSILEAGGLRDAFTAVVGADDVRRTKPAPDPYLAALERLRRGGAEIAAEQCLVLEDSVPGIMSALAAGMRVAGVAHTYPPEKLRSAHHVFPSLQGVTPDTLRGLFA